MIPTDFFSVVDRLLAENELRIDRAAGSAHPRYPEMTYPLDYGFIKDTAAGDGDGIDVFRGSASGRGVVATAFTVDIGKRDLEAKVLVDCSDEEIDVVVAFLASTLGLGVEVVRRDRGGAS